MKRHQMLLNFLLSTMFSLDATNIMSLTGSLRVDRSMKVCPDYVNHDLLHRFLLRGNGK